MHCFVLTAWGPQQLCALHAPLLPLLCLHRGQASGAELPPAAACTDEATLPIFVSYHALFVCDGTPGHGNRVHGGISFSQQCARWAARWPWAHARACLDFPPEPLRGSVSTCRTHPAVVEVAALKRHLQRGNLAVGSRGEVECLPAGVVASQACGQCFQGLSLCGRPFPGAFVSWRLSQLQDCPQLESNEGVAAPAHPWGSCAWGHVVPCVHTARCPR
jgi:hypothetical protein